MTAFSGALVLLKIRHNDKMQIIGGMRATKFTITNQLIDSTNKDSGRWRALLPDAGISHVTVGGNGIFTDSTAEQYLRELAFNNKITYFEICFANNDVIGGDFQIANYERIGNFNEEEHYSILLESSGKVVYSMAAKESFSDVEER